MLRFDHVSLSYGSQKILNDLCFEIEEGQFAVLIGPSGCGKTTTLKMINRLIQPDTGKIYLNEEDITSKDKVELRRHIGYVIQQIGLFPNMTVEQNMAFGLKIQRLSKAEINDRITEIFAGIPALYVADGHHRTAAAARVGKKRQESNPNHTGNEEYCYFLAVTFPASQLRIIDYNRVVKDLNGMTTEQFLKALEKNFTVEPKGKEIYHPSKLHNFSLYLDGQWYSLTAKPGTYDDNDPIGVLDVTVLSNLVLDQLLDIKDLRTSKRIDFVGGIRGLEELKKRVDSGEMKAAFALYPVSMQQLIDIADTGNIMPPKTTWFEPKLRSGVVIHTFEEK